MQVVTGSPSSSTPQSTGFNLYGIIIRPSSPSRIFSNFSRRFVGLSSLSRSTKQASIVSTRPRFALLPRRRSPSPRPSRGRARRAPTRASSDSRPTRFANFVLAISDSGANDEARAFGAGGGGRYGVVANTIAASGALSYVVLSLSTFRLVRSWPGFLPSLAARLRGRLGFIFAANGRRRT